MAPRHARMAGQVDFDLNGVTRQVDIEPGMSLLELLRGPCGLRSMKDGCAPEGSCGACTVIVDGRAVVSCAQPAERVSGRRVETLEGLPGDDPRALGRCLRRHRRLAVRLLHARHRHEGRGAAASPGRAGPRGHHEGAGREPLSLHGLSLDHRRHRAGRRRPGAAVRGRSSSAATASGPARHATAAASRSWGCRPTWPTTSCRACSMARCASPIIRGLSSGASTRAPPGRSPESSPWSRRRRAGQAPTRASSTTTGRSSWPRARRRATSGDVLAAVAAESRSGRPCRRGPHRGRLRGPGAGHRPLRGHGRRTRPPSTKAATCSPCP